MNSYKELVHEKFGDILLVDKYGNELNRYSDIEHVAKEISLVNKPLFNFERMQNNGKKVTDIGVALNNKMLKQRYDQISFFDSIRRMLFSTFYLNRFTYKNVNKNNCEISYCEINDIAEKAYRRIVTEANFVEFRKSYDNKSLYFNTLKNILQIYKVNSKCLFKKINDYNEIPKFPGIYIICFKKTGVLYAGQSKISLYRRIKEHFNSHGDMANFFGICDVSSIYILPTEYLINEIENDLISLIPKECAINCQTNDGCFITNIWNDSIGAFWGDARKHFLLDDIERQSIIEFIAKKMNHP